MADPRRDYGNAAPVRGGLRESIVRLVRDASIEASTKNLAEINTYDRLLVRASDVYVTFLPATPCHYIISVARRLRERGMNPVPHVAARRLASEGVASQYLTRLRVEAGVTRVMLIAGDSEAAAGPFASSLALLESGLLQACGIESVGIAGYPEGHRSIPGRAITQSLDRKIEYAGAHGLDLFMVSQFCFDGQQVLDWLAGLRARGVTLPVRIGMAGPSTVRTLLSYGARCGIGKSLQTVFGAKPVSITCLVAWYGPERLVELIAGSAAGDLGIAGLHFFPFGGFSRSARWIGEVAAGRFRLGDPGDAMALLSADPAA